MNIPTKFFRKAPLASAACLLGLLTFAPPAVADDSLVERMRQGMNTLESACTACHTLDKPLAKDMDRARWDALLISMMEKGAKVSDEEKGPVVEFLAARRTFNAKCTVCHERQQVFDREKVLADWQETVRKMGEKQPDLLSEDEIAAISAYLALILGSPPSWMGK